MADKFQAGELVRVKTSHHKIAPKGSIVRVLREHRTRRRVGEYWGSISSGPWIDWEPLVNRGGKKNKYTWKRSSFEKL